MRKILMSFAARLSFYILILTSLIFLCIAVVFHRYSRLREERQAVLYTSLLQEKLIQKVDFELVEVEKIVRREIPRLKKHLSDPDEIMPIVSEMVATNSLIMGGSVAFSPNYYPAKGEKFMEYAYMDDTHGKERLRTKHLGDSIYNYLNMEWFAQAKHHKEGMWSDPYFDRGGGDKLMTTYALPLYDAKGRFIAVITADVSLEDLSINMFTIRPYPDSYSFIINNKGTFISHPDKNVILKENIFSRAKELGSDDLALYAKKMVEGEKGSFRSKLDGVSVLCCYAPLDRTDWSICSVCPYSTVMSQLGSATWTILFILLVGLILLSWCIRQLVKYIAKPIRQLTDATYQIAMGNFDCPLPQIDSKDDLRMLHDAFEHMQQSLASYTEELKNTTRQKERIESELSIAHDIQMDIVPKSFSPFAGHDEVDLYALLRPAKEVGGDLYDYFFRHGKLYFCIGDVSGKGVPASLVMAITTTLFRLTAHSYDSPAVIVTKLNNALSANNEALIFVTMFVGILDLQTGSLTYCNAGHNPPVLLGENGESSFLPVKANIALGVMSGREFAEQQIKLEANHALLLYTDGLTEAENSQKEQFGEANVLTLLARYASCPIRETIDSMIADLSTFVDGAEQSDDLTLLGIRWTPSMGEVERELNICNELSESEKLVPFIESIGEELQLPTSLVMSLNLALEEALVNVIQYAYPDGVKGNVVLRAHWDKQSQDAVTFVLEDKGKAFDPTQVREADVTLGVEERPIGGLGIFLIRKLMDEVSYQRKDDKNLLVMVKRIKTENE